MIPQNPTQLHLFINQRHCIWSLIKKNNKWRIEYSRDFIEKNSFYGLHCNALLHVKTDNKLLLIDNAKMWTYNIATDLWDKTIHSHGLNIIMPYSGCSWYDYAHCNISKGIYLFFGGSLDVGKSKKIWLLNTYNLSFQNSNKIPWICLKYELPYSMSKMTAIYHKEKEVILLIGGTSTNLSNADLSKDECLVLKIKDILPSEYRTNII